MTYCSVECQQADWQFHKYPKPSKARSQIEPNGLEKSTDINYLRMNTDLESPGFGLAPTDFLGKDGASVLLAQTEEGDLYKEEVTNLIEALKNTVSRALRSVPPNKHSRQALWDIKESVQLVEWANEQSGGAPYG